MAMKYVCVHGSSASGTCLLHLPSKTWVGTIDTVSGSMKVDGIEAAVVGDSGLADCGHRFQIMTGVPYFTAPNGKAYCTVGDTVEIMGNPLLPGMGRGTGTINSGNSLLQINV